VRSAVPILWHEYSREQLANTPAGMRVSAKSLPPEVKTVRLVEIQGIDLNPCCGTHVPTTASLQMVKFLKAEPVRRPAPPSPAPPLLCPCSYTLPSPSSFSRVTQHATM
jgi:Ser-tRNA(Ala) deacylase AlaX